MDQMFTADEYPCTPLATIDYEGVAGYVVKTVDDDILALPESQLLMHCYKADDDGHDCINLVPADGSAGWSCGTHPSDWALARAV